MFSSKLRRGSLRVVRFRNDGAFWMAWIDFQARPVTSVGQVVSGNRIDLHSALWAHAAQASFDFVYVCAKRMRLSLRALPIATCNIACKLRAERALDRVRGSVLAAQ